MGEGYLSVKVIVDGVFPMSERSLQTLYGLFSFESFKKGEDFIYKDKRNSKEYFLLTGVCKSYLLSPSGDEITISLFTDKSVLSPHSIRSTQDVSNLNFKALTDIELLSMDAQVFEKLMIENLEIRQFGNAVLQNELILKVEKEIGFASLTAKQRLIAFRKKYHFLENQIPHTTIASYLGITNISLSRLRKELSVNRS